MPRFDALALDRTCKELFDTSFFAGERVEKSVDAVELERAWCLVGKCGGEMVHGIFKHVGAVNTNVLGLIWRMFVGGGVTVHGGGNFFGCYIYDTGV